MSERFSSNLALALRVLAAAYLIGLVLLVWFFLPYGDDIAFHLQRLDALSQEFTLGIDWGNFPFRIYTATLDGYGYASPLFYGDLFFYPFALLASWGISVYAAYRLMLIAMLVGAYFSFRLMLREVTSSTRGLGFSLGLFYAVLSTTLYGEIVGSCVGRGFVLVFAPLAFAGFYRVLFTERPRGWLLLAVGAGGTLLAHPINIVLLLAVLLFMLAVNWRHVSTRAVKQILLSAAVAIAATLWYWLPMLEQMLSEALFVTSSVVENGKAALSDFTVPLEGVVLPTQVRSLVLSRLGIDAPQRLYKAGLLVPLIGLCAVFLRRHAWRDRGQGSLFASLVAIVLLVIWFQTPLFPHDLLQGLLGVLQFPWRPFVFVEISMALLLAMAFDGPEAESARTAKASVQPLRRAEGLLACAVSVLVLLYALVFVGFNLRGQLGSFVADGRIVPLSERIPYTSSDIGSGEYVPAALWSTDSPYYDSARRWLYVDRYLADRGCVATSSNSQMVLEARRDGRSTLVDYSGAREGDVISVPLLMYKGYAAVDDATGEVLDVHEGDDGFVEVSVGSSAAGTIRVWYAGTFVQHASTAASFLFVVAAIGCGVAGHLRQRRGLRPERVLPAHRATSNRRHARSSHDYREHG
ncbi:hypothetical protein [Enorma phocaeensis]|uniref:hypothetical protein n=1 Tax=Enorma phocaeensis TaxID=1871019 RepID=UPI00320A04EE